jgi:hypothetical protein
MFQSTQQRQPAVTQAALNSSQSVTSFQFIGLFHLLGNIGIKRIQLRHEFALFSFTVKP